LFERERRKRAGTGEGRRAVIGVEMYRNKQSIKYQQEPAAAQEVCEGGRPKSGG